MKRIRVSVPATTANLGPGFDCLGLALSLYNEVTLTALGCGLEIAISGEGAGALPTDEGNLVYRAAHALFERVGRAPAGLQITQVNRIPVGSGLGSSAAATVGGLLAANALVDGGLAPAELLDLAHALEGHPDNAAPALYGGLTLVVPTAQGLLVDTIAVPPLKVVIVLPDFDLATRDARAALPRQVPLAAAVFNAGRVGLLVRALAAADYAKLAVAMDDRLHQPYRAPLVPGLAAALAAAHDAGAAGAAISGAGPSVAAFAPAGHAAIAESVAAAFAAAGLTTRHWVLEIAGAAAVEAHAV